LREMPLTPGDAAAAELAVHYATAIDASADDLTKLGPALLAALESLGMTPRARKSLVKGGDGDGPTSPLDELRQRRADRDAGAN